MNAPVWQGLLALGTGVLSGMGVGGGSLLVALLAGFFAVEQRRAQGINLLTFLPTAFVAVLLHTRRRTIRWKAALWAAAAGLPAAALGSVLANALPEQTLQKVFAGLLFFTGLRGLFTAEGERRNKK